MTVWPSGLRRWLQAPVRKGVGSNPTAVSVPSLQTAGCATTRLNVSSDGSDHTGEHKTQTRTQTEHQCTQRRKT